VRVLMKVYLIGGMQFAEDGGRTWRRELGAWLKEQGFTVLDPLKFNKEKLLDEADPGMAMKAAIREVIRYDIDVVVNKMDFGVCYYDESMIGGGGSHSECTQSLLSEKDLLIVLTIPKERASAWTLACATKVVGSIEELKEYILGKYRKRTEDE